jgi:hypothetical protein
MAAISYTRTQDHWEQLPSTNTPADAVDLENWDQLGLMSNNTRICLIWNGTTYVLPKYTPASGFSLSDTSRLRHFFGPVAPWTISGVVMGNYDCWTPVG